jgi:hypothetical protein
VAATRIIRSHKFGSQKQIRQPRPDNKAVNLGEMPVVTENGGAMLQGRCGNPQIIGRDRLSLAPKCQVYPRIELGRVRFHGQQSDSCGLEKRPELAPVFALPPTRGETAQQFAEHYRADPDLIGMSQDLDRFAVAALECGVGVSSLLKFALLSRAP